MASDSAPPTEAPARRARSPRQSAGASSLRGQRRASAPPVPPVLVRQLRGEIVEGEHRGHIVEADASGRLLRVLGNPDRIVLLRSCVKPFGLTALIEAGGIAAFDLTPPELAIMASSHSGEDIHVRTLQGVFRRAGVTQTLLACGTEGMPLDALTAARLARDGERTSSIRHMCSGQHAVGILLSRMRGWPLETYWQEDHPAQIEYRAAVARAFATSPDRLPRAIDDCGLPTFAVYLRDVATAYAMLADPDALPASDPRASLAPALRIVRDAMLANPELIGGTRERLDTSLMKGLPGALISKTGMEALRGMAILPRARTTDARRATGIAIKIEDGGGLDRAPWAAAVEALAQVGVLSGQPLRMLSRYHRPITQDPHGRTAAEAIADFELAPVGELTR